MCMFYVYNTPTFVHTLLQLFVRLLSVLYIARIAVLLVGFGSLWHQFCNKVGTYFSDEPLCPYCLFTCTPDYKSFALVQ
jgi:hypothetical protein